MAKIRVFLFLFSDHLKALVAVVVVVVAIMEFPSSPVDNAMQAIVSGNDQAHKTSSDRSIGQRKKKKKILKIPCHC